MKLTFRRRSADSKEGCRHPTFISCLQQERTGSERSYVQGPDPPLRRRCLQWRCLPSYETSFLMNTRRHGDSRPRSARTRLPRPGDVAPAHGREHRRRGHRRTMLRFVTASNYPVPRAPHPDEHRPSTSIHNRNVGLSSGTSITGFTPPAIVHHPPGLVGTISARWPPRKKGAIAKTAVQLCHAPGRSSTLAVDLGNTLGVLPLPGGVYADVPAPSAPDSPDRWCSTVAATPTPSSSFRPAPR